jgi:hypothetical protein
MRLVEFLVGFRCFLPCRNACTHLQNLEQDKMILVEENGIILSHDYLNAFGVTKAFDALVWCFKNAENEGQEKERRRTYFSPLGKRLVLGTIIGRQDGVDNRASGSRQG